MYFFNLLHHFFIRDLKIFLSYKFSLVMQIIFVITLLFFLNYIFISLGIDYTKTNNFSLGRLLIGVALIDFMLSCISVFNREVRNAQQFGTFEILFQSQIPIYLVMIASYSFTFFKTSFRVLAYIFISAVIFDIEISYLSIPIFLILMIFFSIPYIGIGMMSASFIIYFKRGNFINMIISFLSIFSSGIFFSVEALPIEFQWLSEFNPLSNSIDLITNTIVVSGESLSSSDRWSSFNNNILQIFITVPLGLFLVYYAFKASKINGSLNHY